MTLLSWRCLSLLVFLAVVVGKLHDSCSSRHADGAPEEEQDVASLIQDLSMKAFKRAGLNQDSPADAKEGGVLEARASSPDTKPSKADQSDPSKKFVSSATSAIVAACVVGVFLLFAILMCYTQLKAKVDAKVPMAWFFLSSFIAVLCAALLCTAIRDLTAWLFYQVLQVEPLYLDVIRLVGIYLLVQVLLFATKRNFWILEGIGAVASFVVGFALVEVFAHLMKMQTFTSSWLVLGMAVLSATACTLIMVLGLSITRECCRGSEGSRFSQLVHGGHWLQWHDVCGEVELMAAAVGLGSIFCKVITYVILDDIALTNQSSVNVSMRDVLILGVVAIGILGSMILLIACRVQFQQDASGEQAKQFESFVLYSMGMTAAWCCLTAGQWIFWDGLGLVTDASGRPDQVSARLLMAGAFSAAVLLVLSLLISATGFSGSKSKYLQVTSCSLALLLGLAWEAWFAQVAIGYGRLVQACLCIAFCVLLLTTWGFYILPHAVHKKWLLDNSDGLEDALKQPMQHIEPLKHHAQHVEYRVASVMHPQMHSQTQPISPQIRRIGT